MPRLLATLVVGLLARPILADDPVLRWNELLLGSVKTSVTPPPMAARNMAIVHIAIFDAVNGLERKYEHYLVNPRSAPLGASQAAAIAGAAHTTLSALYPAYEDVFDTALQAELAGIPPFRALLGYWWGRFVANEVLRLRQDDGAFDTVAYTPGSDPGDWRPTPPGFASAVLPNWPDVMPFAMDSGDQFRPDGPPSLTDPEYTAAFEEVKSLGKNDSVTRTPEQSDIARFWADGAGTVTPPGHWNVIAHDVAVARGNTLLQNARLFALLNISLADAGIVAWDAIYEFELWRPVSGINLASTDGNPDTSEDATWQPFLTTPPFPAYTSGHSTFSSAAAAVLGRFFGTDNIAFSTESEDLPGVVRSFVSFSDAAAEAGISRIYGGIHWSFDNEDGLSSGGALGDYVFENFLRPVKKHHK